MGFSGGGDSTALLALLAPLARAAGKPLVALIVDHALRAESALEAGQAAAAAERLGATPRVVRLDWPNGGAGQARARAARHRVFAREAEELGADRIHLGHTADDQAETVLMRLRRGSGRAGLSGMAPLEPSAFWPDGRSLLIARPLLGLRREALRDRLRAEGLDWIEDPSNAARRYERVRLRDELSGRDPGRLLALARRAAARRRRIDAEALALFSRSAHLRDDTLRLDGAVIDRADERALRLVSVVAAACGGARREPTADAASRLIATLRREGAATLSGSLWRVRRGGVEVGRDPGGLLGRADGPPPLPALPLPKGREVAWDGRLALIAREAGLSLAPGGRYQQPEVRAAQATFDLASAEAQGLIAFRWLLEMRIRRSLWRALGEESLTGCV